MTDLTKYYIDLSKCTEEQRKHVISLLPEPLIPYQYKIFSHFKFLYYERAMRIWIVTSIEFVCNRTELTYPEFIKLFEGGEETEVQKLKKQIGLYKECFELFIPTDKWDEANEFLSINNNPLAKHLSKVQRGVEKKPKF